MFKKDDTMTNGVDQQGLLKRGVTNPTTWIAILVLGLLILVVLILFSGTRPIADELPNLEFARGVITLVFVLFTIGFAAIVLTYGLFFSEVDKEDRRFTRGREVLGLFIGIVGTIVGFYFGSAEKPSAKFDVAVQALRQPASKAVVVSAHAVGGTPPYRFTVLVGSKKVTDPPVKSDDGWLSRTFDANDAAELTVEATDAKDLRATKKERIKGPTAEEKKPTEEKMPAGENK